MLSVWTSALAGGRQLSRFALGRLVVTRRGTKDGDRAPRPDSSDRTSLTTELLVLLGVVLIGFVLPAVFIDFCVWEALAGV